MDIEILGNSALQHVITFIKVLFYIIFIKVSTGIGHLRPIPVKRPILTDADTWSRHYKCPVIWLKGHHTVRQMPDVCLVYPAACPCLRLTTIDMSRNIAFESRTFSDISCIDKMRTAGLNSSVIHHNECTPRASLKNLDLKYIEKSILGRKPVIIFLPEDEVTTHYCIFYIYIFF